MDNSTFNVNLFGGAMAGPCFGDGSDSEASQRSQVTCVGQEEDANPPTLPAGTDDHDALQQNPGQITDNALDMQLAPCLPAFASNDNEHICNITSVGSIPSCSSSAPAFAPPAAVYVSALGSSPAFESTPAPAPNAASELEYANISGAEDAQSLGFIGRIATLESHIPSQEFDTPDPHGDQRLDTIAMLRDPSQDILITASADGEPCMHRSSSSEEEQASQPDDAHAHQSDAQHLQDLFNGIEPTDGADNSDGGAKNVDFSHQDTEGGYFRGNSPPASDAPRSSTPMAEVEVAQSYSPAPAGEIDAYSAEIACEEEDSTMADGVGNGDDGLAPMGDVGSYSSRDGMRPSEGPDMSHGAQLAEVGRMNDESDNGTGFARPILSSGLDDHTESSDLLYGPEEERNPNETLKNEQLAELELDDTQPPAFEELGCPPSSSPPSSSPPTFFSSSQASRSSSQSSAALGPAEAMDECFERLSVPMEATSTVVHEPESIADQQPAVASTSEMASPSVKGPLPSDSHLIAVTEPEPLVPQKRKCEEDDLGDIEVLRHIPPPPPTTKRPTALAHKVQFKKLAKPFRPPAMKPKAEAEDTVLPSSSPPRSSPPCSSSPQSSGPKPPPSTSHIDRKKAHRTQRAASQFKSPLTPGASAAVSSNVRLTPHIQALERKLQALKRAVKVRREGEEATLEGLVKRWTEAGREVAWEVWGLTKEQAEGGDWGYGGQAKGGGFGRDEDANRGWGWDKEEDRKGGSSWGWATEAGGEDAEDKDGAQYRDEEEEQERPQQTLGTMLRHLGIAPETLGWDDNEEGFVDV